MRVYFNPLPSYEGRPAISGTTGKPLYFNPLPSCEGRPDLGTGDQGDVHFNPLPSHEGRPLQAGKREDIIGISIHSPPARGDRPALWSFQNRLNFNPLPSYEGRQHKPPKIHPDLRQLTQQNHDTPLFGALQAPFCGAEPDIRGAKPQENHDSFTFARPSEGHGITP